MYYEACQMEWETPPWNRHSPHQMYRNKYEHVEFYVQSAALFLSAS